MPTSDVGNVLRAFGHNPTEAELQDLLASVDSGSGKLTFGEINACVSNYQPSGDYATQIRDAFKIFDKDGKGSISTAELKHIMQNLGEKMSEEEVSDMMKEANLDAKGSISVDNFISTMLAKV